MRSQQPEPPCKPAGGRSPRRDVTGAGELDAAAKSAALELRIRPAGGARLRAGSRCRDAHRLAVAGGAGSGADRQPRLAAGGRTSWRRSEPSRARASSIFPAFSGGAPRTPRWWWAWLRERSVAARLRRRCPSALLRPLDAALSVVHGGGARVPIVSVGQPAARVRAARLLLAFAATGAARPLPVPFVAFKLYFESGIAKWQSPVHDWQDGSAMTAYYETAPLPTRLAFYAHHLPVWWHHLESRATLALELVVPFCIFGPRRTRLVAGVRVHAVSDPQRLHRQLRLLLLPGLGAAPVPSRRRRPGTPLGKAARPPAVRGPARADCGSLAAPERPLAGPRSRRRLRRDFAGRRHAPVRRARHPASGSPDPHSSSMNGCGW